jgi:hypothetical protein
LFGKSKWSRRLLNNKHIFSITPPNRLVHVMNTLEKGRMKREAVEKVILEKQFST